jgi:hypothetical protein
MPVYRTGIANSNKGISGVSSSPNLQDQISNLKSQITFARVTDIVLNDQHPQFNIVGQYNGIGAIFYEIVNALGKTSGNNFALPYNAQLKTYPLVNEIVLLINSPSSQQGELSSNSSYFYMSPLALWNHPHHDAYPNPITTGAALSQNQDYVSNGEGNVRRVEDGSTEINLNYKNYPNPSQDNFIEESNIHPLLPFTGDSLLEGRFGQSIRFGHTTLNQTSNIQNNWSSAGKNTDPITIIRNGQPTNVNDKGWIPITENLSNDLSSIYLTSYQQLNTFKVASELYQSYTTPPKFPSQYKNPQVILNSDRIVINAKTDSILLSAQQSIGMSTNGSVNIDATSHYISSNDIKLGSKDATQPVLLGNDTIDVLIQLTEAIKDLASILQVQRDYPGGVLATSFNSVAGNVLTQINSANGILAQLNNDSLKSKTTKVQ